MKNFNSKKLLYKVICIFITMITHGCADHFSLNHEKIEEIAKNEKWNDAYIASKDSLNFSHDGKNKDIINKYPKILEIGMKEYYKDKLDNLKNNCNNSEFINFLYELNLVHNNKNYNEFDKITVDECRDGLNLCMSDKNIYISYDFISNFENRVGYGYFTDKTKIDFEKNRLNRIGVIINHQITDISNVNNNDGAKLLSLYGQSNYLDSHNVNNYRATGQLNSAVAWYMVGSALIDKPTKIIYIITYFIKLNSGDVKKFDIYTDNKIYIPEGSCVEASMNKIALVEQKNCQ